MRIPVFLGLAVLLFGQSASAPRNGLKSFGFSPPAEHLKLWLPPAYEPDLKLARKYVRKPSLSNPEVVALRVDILPVKLPVPPTIPLEPDLMRVDPSLVNLRFTGTVASWRGRPVSTARYEGFVQGDLGVFGRMAWLPLQPGTVVVNLYAEPNWVPAMNLDWDVILANIEGPISEFTLRERAPGRWLAAKSLGALGCVLALAGLVILLARMNESMGGAVVYIGLLLPIVPVGYALFHLHRCWRGLLGILAGGILFGLSILLEY